MIEILDIWLYKLQYWSISDELSMLVISRPRWRCLNIPDYLTHHIILTMTGQDVVTNSAQEGGFQSQNLLDNLSSLGLSAAVLDYGRCRITVHSGSDLHW